jgi:small subunit ribosomal protein S6
MNLTGPKIFNQSPKGDYCMRHYEIIYIINPNQTDDEFNEIIEKFNNLITAQKGVIIKTQKWGKQRLAYTVKKFNNGFYVYVDFCANPGVTTELERNLNLDDRIIKYQTVKLAEKADPQELLEKERESQKETAFVAPEAVLQEPAAAPVETEVEETVESEVENG